MNNKVYLESSGIPLVDKAWGGFYIGGTYFLIGQHRSGKTILGIQNARECVRQKQVCLYFTSMRPKDLLILASSIDFEMEAFINQNLIIVIKIAIPTRLSDINKNDDELTLLWNEIIKVIDHYKADKIIFDDFTPFIGFNKSTSLTESFQSLMGTLEQKQMTSLFILSDPANLVAENLVDGIVQEGNGVIYINNKDLQEDGKMTITPILGHPEGQFKSKYTMNAYEGITVDFIDPSPLQEVAKGKIKNGCNNHFNAWFKIGKDSDELNFGNDGPGF